MSRNHCHTRIYRYALYCITPLISLFLIWMTTSCRRGDYRLPQVSLTDLPGFIHTDTVLPAGSLFRIRLQISGPDVSITNIIISRTGGGIRTVVFDTGVNNPALGLTKTLTRGVDPEELWTFTVIDREGGKSSVDLKIGLNADSGFREVITFHLRMGAQQCPDTGSFASLWSFRNFFTQAAFMIQDSIDLVYFFDPAGDRNTIASPNANIDPGFFPGPEGLEFWNIRHETRYYKTNISQAVFDACTHDSLLLVSYNELNAKRKAKLLAIGDIYVFKTDASRYGMFRVTDVVGAGDGTVNIVVKVQKP